MAKKKRMSPEYKRGYIDGLKARGQKVLDEDLNYIYGGMGIQMFRKGYKPKTIMWWIKAIQKIWIEYSENGRDIVDDFYELTGINIDQCNKEDVDNI